MNCRYDDGFIIRYLEKDLSLSEKKAFENHLKLCSKCQLALEQENKLRLKKSSGKSVATAHIMIEKMHISNAKSRWKEPDTKSEAVFLQLFRKYGIPVISAILLIFALIIPEVSKPLWGSIMEILESKELSVSAETNHEKVFEFDGGIKAADELQLIENMNSKGMGVSPWQVIYADENKIFIRNTFFIMGYKEQSLYQVADLSQLRLNHTQGTIVTGFSLSPTGDFLLAGNTFFEGVEIDSTYGVYIIDTTEGSYFRLFNGGLNDLVYSWSPDGRYLAYYGKEHSGITIVDTESKKTTLLEYDGSSVKNLFMSYSGKISAFTGNQIITSSINESNWEKAGFAVPPIHIDPDNKTVWFIKDGVLLKQTLGTGTAPTPVHKEEDNIITSWRITGEHLVYKLSNGNIGDFNIHDKTSREYELNNQLTGDFLPWHDITPMGSRIMLENGTAFAIASQEIIQMLDLNKSGILSPSCTRWMDEECFLYVKLHDSNADKAGEFSLMVYNTTTGEESVLYKTVEPEAPVEDNRPQAQGTTEEKKQPEPKTTIYEKVKATGNWAESLVIKASPVKNGPSERYSDTGDVKEGEIIVFNNKSVNGWFLAKSLAGSGPKEFWIPSENILTYERGTLPAGIITADSVELGSISLEKGNLIRIIRHEDNMSYIIPDTVDVNVGITGWINNNNYTMSFNGIYFNQAYLRGGSIIYSSPGLSSDPVENYDKHVNTDSFIEISERQNGFAHIHIPGGALSGWAQEADIYIPSGDRTDTTEAKPGYDLDGDGIKDVISFETDGSTYTLIINNVMVQGEGQEIQPQYKVVDIDTKDSYMEIVIEELGPSDDLMSTFYHYDSNDIILMGQVSGLCGNNQSVKGNGTVMAQTRGSTLETWFFQDEYKMNKEYRLTQVPRIFYEKIGYSDALPLKLIIPELRFLTSPDGDTAFILYQGEEIVFVGSDNKRWCMFKTHDGRTGWLEVNDFWDIAGTGLNAGDVFEGLCLAD